MKKVHKFFYFGVLAPFFCITLFFPQLTQSQSSLASFNESVSKVVGSGKAGLQSTNSTANAELSNLIGERKKLAQSLMSSNPAAFLQNVMPKKVRSALPQSLQDDVEYETTISGKIKVLHIDDFKNHKNAKYRYFVEAKVKTGISLMSVLGLSKTQTEDVEIFPTRQFEMRSGATVKVSGYRLSNLMAADNTNEDSSGIEVIDDALPPESVGSQRTLILLIKTSNVAPEPFTTEEVRDRVFNGQFEQYMEQQSYGKVSFKGDVYGWYDLGHDLDCYRSGAFFPTSAELSTMVNKYGIDLEKYDRVVYISNSNGGGCSWIGKLYHFINSKDLSFSELIVEGASKEFDPNRPFLWGYFEDVLSHEMGHSLGLDHANSWKCADVTLYGDCYHQEYGNYYDMMGSNGVYSMHFNALYKDELGWIPKDQKIKINKTGKYTIHPLEFSEGVKLAEIVDDKTSKTLYTVEYRKGVGFDANLNDKPVFDVDPRKAQKGIFVNRIQPSTSGTTELLDLTPDDYWQMQEPTLNDDSTEKTFFDAGRGIHIGPVTAVTDDSITFDVTYGLAKCVSGLPSIRYSSFDEYSAPGQIFTGYAVLQDNAVNCGESIYKVKNSLNWPMEIEYDGKKNDDNVIKTKDGILNTARISFKVPENESEGTKQIDVTFTDENGISKHLYFSTTLVKPLSLDYIKPAEGPVGTRVLVEGKGITSISSVIFNNQYIWDKSFMVDEMKAGITGVIFSIPATYDDPECVTEKGGDGICKQLPITTGKYLVKVCASSRCEELSFTVTSTTTVVAPSIKVASSSLFMVYNSKKDEVELKTMYDIEVSAGGQDVSITKQFPFSIVFRDGVHTYYPYNNYTIKTAENIVAGSSYIVPAEKSAHFKVETSIIPVDNMFSGKYRSSLETMSLLHYAEPDIRAPKNETNAVTVIGEKSPWINEIKSTASKCGNLITINGEKFSTYNNTVILKEVKSENYIFKQFHNIPSDKKGTQIQIVSSWNGNIAEGSYLVQVNNDELGNKGRSNFATVQIKNEKGLEPCPSPASSPTITTEIIKGQSVSGGLGSTLSSIVGTIVDSVTSVVDTVVSSVTGRHIISENRSASPTPSVSSTPGSTSTRSSASPSASPSSTSSPSPKTSPSSSASPKANISPSSSPGSSPKVNSSATPTSSVSATPKTSTSASPTSSASPTASATKSSTPTPKPSSSTSPSSSPTSSPSSSPSYSPASTPSSTPTSFPANTPSSTPSSTPTPVSTPQQTSTPASTPSSTPTTMPSTASTPVSTPANSPASTPYSTPISSPSTPIAPIANLTANGSHNVTLNTGSSVTYSWSSAYGNQYYSTYTSNNSSLCGSGGAWLANTSSGSATVTLSSAYAGCSWVVKYYVTNTSTGITTVDTMYVYVTSPSATPTSSPHPSSSPTSYNAKYEYKDMLSNLFTPWISLINLFNTTNPK